MEGSGSGGIDKRWKLMCCCVRKMEWVMGKPLLKLGDNAGCYGQHVENGDQKKCFNECTHVLFTFVNTNFAIGYSLRGKHLLFLVRLWDCSEDYNK